MNNTIKCLFLSRYDRVQTLQMCVCVTVQVLPVASGQSHHVWPVLSCCLVEILTPYCVQAENESAKESVSLHVTPHHSGSSSGYCDRQCLAGHFQAPPGNMTGKQELQDRRVYRHQEASVCGISA